MSTEENTGIVRRITEAWNGGDLGIIDETLAADFAGVPLTRKKGDVDGDCHLPLHRWEGRGVVGQRGLAGPSATGRRHPAPG
jgi:hypothetical protein